MVRNVIREEWKVFSDRYDNVVENRTYPIKINLKDNNPVQLNYNLVPRNLYNELKMYIEDLLNKKWIVHSSSSYSSTAVVVRKKDGSIRMCCDYRKLVAKTKPERHPCLVFKIVLIILVETSILYFWIKAKHTKNYTYTQIVEN